MGKKSGQKINLQNGQQVQILVHKPKGEKIFFLKQFNFLFQIYSSVHQKLNLRIKISTFLLAAPQYQQGAWASVKMSPPQPGHGPHFQPRTTSNLEPSSFIQTTVRCRTSCETLLGFVGWTHHSYFFSLISSPSRSHLENGNKLLHSQI